MEQKGQLAWRWNPAELQERQQQSARSGLAARGEKNRTFAGSVYREGGPPASKDYTIALVQVSETNRGVVLMSLS